MPSERSIPRPAPRISSRSQPKVTGQRKQQLADAFLTQGPEYDELRPGYPAPVVDAIVAAAGVIPGAAPAAPDAAPAASDTAPATFDAAPASPNTAHAAPNTAHAAPFASAEFGPRRPDSGRLFATDLGAGTGKLTRALAERVRVAAQTTGEAETAPPLVVTAVDPSEAMLQQLRDRMAVPESTMCAAPGADTTVEVRTMLGTAEQTGLPDSSQSVVTVAQAWHWFDRDRATQEILRILAPGGVVALVWNTLDVAIPWVHRYSRIMHAGDVQRDGFMPDVGEGLQLVDRMVHRWEDQRRTHELINLALTRSYAVTAPVERRERVLANLDWYVHEHLGHAPGATVGIPYRTDLFLYRRAL